MFNLGEAILALLEIVFGFWNNQVSLVFELLGQSPTGFKGGGPWGIIEGIEPLFVGIGSALVGKLADENCALFLWITFPLLKEIWRVVKAWGFTYKTVAFVWIKQNKKADSLFWGMGYWTRANAEICILATKGSPKRYSRRVHQVLITHIEEHSKKPGEARNRIEQLMGDVPRVELFARREAPGWDVWGNEVVCSPGTEVLQHETASICKGQEPVRREDM